MKFVGFILFLLISPNLNGQTPSEEELPGLLKSELQELVEQAKIVEISLPEESPPAPEATPTTIETVAQAEPEDSAQVEETIATQAAAPVRKETQGNEIMDETPKRLSRSRGEIIENRQESAPAEIPPQVTPARIRQRGR
ncbi:MAG: hypothetical protein HYV97_07310 [Bdellovibrio sp.]|nr:hypothetical protein [Bdellovibrio sp.]